MGTYEARVRVPKSGGIGTMTVPVRILARDPIAARSQLEAQYGRGNVMSVPQRIAQ